MGMCCIKDCERPLLAKGMCGVHYMRMKRNGSPTKVSRIVGGTPEQRFWTYVTKTESCWMWTGSVSHTYGSFHLDMGENGTRRQVAAHRFAYELLIGPIPEGMTLDHVCHTPQCQAGKDCAHRRCVNPDHLEPASLRDNIRRTGAGHKTHCKRGHEFTPENTTVFVNAVGGPGRKCKTCAREEYKDSQARWRAENRDRRNAQKRARRAAAKSSPPQQPA